MHDDGPTMASLLHKGCQVTHFKNSRGWLETPDGRFFKPEPEKVQFIKGLSKPFMYVRKVNKGLATALTELIKRLIN